VSLYQAKVLIQTDTKSSSLSPRLADTW